MDIQIGSDHFCNTDGTVEIEGVPQVFLSQKKPGGALLVNLVLYDEVGRVVAKIVDSTMAFNERRAYELSKTPTSLTVTHAESGKLVLKVEVSPEGKVSISRADFLTVKGHLLEVSPSEWKIQNRRGTGQSVDAKGAAAAIG
jgi:hypothetical protein